MQIKVTTILSQTRILILMFKPMRIDMPKKKTPLPTFSFLHSTLSLDPTGMQSPEYKGTRIFHPLGTPMDTRCERELL